MIFKHEQVRVPEAGKSLMKVEDIEGREYWVKNDDLKPDTKPSRAQGFRVKTKKQNILIMEEAYE